MRTWCHGAPGVALGLASGGETRPGFPPATLDHALALTLTTPVHGVDHLCCGSFGVAEVLLATGTLLNRKDLVQAAGGRMAMAIQRAYCLSNSGFQLDEGNPGNPGFFRGLAGIGYQLLRLARPGLLPSVLSFQSPAPAAGLIRSAVATNQGHPHKEVS